MDHKFTENIKQWLETPSNQRDYSVGALYLLKLSGNQIMYRNIVAQLDRRHGNFNAKLLLPLGYSLCFFTSILNKI